MTGPPEKDQPAISPHAQTVLDEAQTTKDRLREIIEERNGFTSAVESSFQKRRKRKPKAKNGDK